MNTPRRRRRGARPVPRGTVEVHSGKQFAALSASQRETYQRVLDATRLTREGYSVSEAARAAGTTPATIRRYAGSAFEKSRDGRMRARPADRLFRRINVMTPTGTQWVNTTGSRQASLAAKHANAVDRYRATGDTRALRRFVGKKIGGVELVTDPDMIERLTNAGQLSFEQFYGLR